MTRLQQHWHTVLRTFFPTWVTVREWRCTPYTRRTALGYCNLERRVIEIGMISDDDDELDNLLIHEIVHATASGSHDKKWQNRMLRAARKARKLRRDRLANLLEQEVASYRESMMTMAYAYQMVEDALNENPKLTLRQIKRWLAQEYGLLLREVDGSFRRLPKAYAAARQYALDARQARHCLLGGRGRAASGLGARTAATSKDTI